MGTDSRAKTVSVAETAVTGATPSRGSAAAIAMPAAATAVLAGLAARVAVPASGVAVVAAAVHSVAVAAVAQVAVAAAVVADGAKETRT